MDPLTKVAAGEILSSKPPLKSSRTTTLCPNRRASSTTYDPMKPAPPVTKEVGIVAFLSRLCELLWRETAGATTTAVAGRVARFGALRLFPQIRRGQGLCSTATQLG